MELRQLRYFVALAEELHFGRAAARSRIAQPPLSIQIKRLESELRVSLFYRTKRHVELTSAGAALLQHARAALQAADAGLQAAQMAERGEIGEISIGFVSSFLYSILPRVIRVYHERHPAITLRLHELSFADPTPELVRGRIDIALVRPPVSDGLASLRLLDEKLGVALPSDHKLAGARRVSLAQLCDERFVIYRRQTAVAFFDSVISLCRQAGFAPHVVQEADRTLTIFALVAAGLGVALVPGSTRDLVLPGVVFKSLEESVTDFDLLAAWCPENTSPPLHHFVGVLGEVSEQYRNEGSRTQDGTAVAPALAPGAPAPVPPRRVRLRRLPTS